MNSILDILKDIPVSAAQKVRIESLESELRKITDENAALKKENAELKAKTLELKQELSKYRGSEEKFVEHSGVKFRKIQGGGYDKTMPYCPVCELALHESSVANRMTHTCSKCGFIAPFTVRQLSSVTKDLE